MALGSLLAIGGLSTGCVERLIYDLDTGADGTADGGTTEDSECMDECGAGQTCFEGTCVGTGTVRISLSWTVTTDLDLHVFVPDGSWINFESPMTAHGQLDVDDCVAGVCSNPGGVHVENIFLTATAPRGQYEILVVNFDGRNSADYQLEIAGDVAANFSGSIPAVEYAESEVHVVNW